MANTKQARKRARQMVVRNMHLSAQRSQFRTAIKAVRKLIGTGVGVGFWPERTWKSTDTTTTRFSYLAEREFERTIAITRSSRVQPNTEAASFYQFLVDHFADIWNGRMQPPL